MAALIVGLSIMAVMMAVVMPVWKQAAQREKEAELVFRGQQYARAIGLFQRKTANAFPPNIDVLVDQRFLRRKYKDPITNDDFAPLYQGQNTASSKQPGTQPDSGSQGTQGRAGTSGITPPAGSTGAPAAPGGAVGGIMGVTSKSKAKSIRLYNGRSHYNEWQFVFVQQTTAPGGPGGTPGQGQRPGQQPTGPGGVGTGGGQRGGQRGGEGTPPTPAGRGGGGFGPGGFGPFNPFNPPSPGVPQPQPTRRPGGY